MRRTTSMELEHLYIKPMVRYHGKDSWRRNRLLSCTRYQAFWDREHCVMFKWTRIFILKVPVFAVGRETPLPPYVPHGRHDGQ